MYIYISQSPLFGRRLEKKAGEMFDVDENDDEMRLPNLCRKLRGFSISSREGRKKPSSSTIDIDNTRSRERAFCAFLSFPLFNEESKKLYYTTRAL